MSKTLKELAVMAVLLLAVGGGAAHAQDKTDPVVLIASIYKTYTAETNNPGYSDVYSRRLQALIDTDAKDTPEGEAGKIDWDVFVDGNNWELSDQKIALVSKTGTRAQVRAKFDSFKKPHDMIFDLVREDGGWLIDDIRAAKKGGRWTMSKILTGAPDAFPDEKK